ncbi:hypothetical protein QEG73_05140 [Chitinophagaceae bacterium 26-R-25]|nr:hypothetical protein [Chitinophagaceae bacterium 26-R-25]
MLLLKYNLQEKCTCEPKVKECCEPVKNPPDPGGSSDCCYDTWSIEFKEADALYNWADKKVTWLTERQKNLQSHRDMWKTWRDDLDKACAATTKICRQLEIIIHHTSRISHNSNFTKHAINLLFCMLRDFYIQVDELKDRYDDVIKCIKCSNNPALVSGQGVMALIEDYGKKLDAIINTRDELIKMVITAIATINNLNKHIGHHGYNFGLGYILRGWKNAFNCEGKNWENDLELKKAHEGEFEVTNLAPVFEFPICSNGYYKKIEERYQKDNSDLKKLTGELLEATKRRDNLKALRDGLASVVNDPNVDPSKRCAPATK